METEFDGAAIATAAPASDYPPISSYALIGDCRTSALVSRDGSIDWLCLPHFSGPSVFAALLDRRRGGHFSIRPATPYQVERAYIDDTPILRTRFRTETGVLALTDLMPIPPHDHTADMLQPQREILRCVEAIDGEVDVVVRYEPRPNYGRRRIQLRKRGACGWACADRSELYMLHGDVPLTATDNGTALHGRVRLRRGEKRYFSLTYTKSDIGIMMPLAAEADTRLRDTQRFWEDWASKCTYRGPHRSAVIRSMLTLKLLTYQLSGAVVAAATTSLPEWIGGERNWDYRYCWLRDASLTLGAMVDLGFHLEGSAFLAWLLHATRLSQPTLRVLYDVYGETHLYEEPLDHFEGYRRSRPVRIGNGAQSQLQLDAYGSVVLAAFDYVEHGGRLDSVEQRLLRRIGEMVCRCWRQPDHGIWEIRGAARHYTYSKLMCWVALDRLLRLQTHGHLQLPVERFASERDAIRDAIETRGFSQTLGAYSAAFDESIPDASLLLMARYGFKPGTDERIRATFDCVERTLSRGDLVYRYPTEIDGIDGREGAFVIASFWAVDYLVRAGHARAADERFRRLLARANDVGLYGEEIDPANGETLGNFPQAFSHVGVIAAANCLAVAASRGEY